MDSIIFLIIGGILVYGCAVFYWLRVLSAGSGSIMPLFSAGNSIHN